MKILASYRLSLVELLCRINCCNIHAFRLRIVYHWSGMEKEGLFSLAHVQVRQTLLTCFEFHLVDVASLLAA